jgi:pimeloyl-ACP methyl ester carboxylesterase
MPTSGLHGFLEGTDRPERLRTVAVAAVAAGVAVIVGRSGSPVWQAARVLGVVVLAGGAMFVVVRHSRRQRGAALLLVAWIGIAVGAGIAPAWLSKAGIGVTSLAGVLSLMAGAALVAFALADLVGGVRLWLRLGAGLAALVVLAVVAFSLAIAVAATNVPPTDLGDETPGQRGLTFAEVRFPAADGVMLSGWYVPSANRAAVALLHGAGSTRSSVLDHAAVVAGHGYGVLLFDARGHGASDGRAMDLGWFGDADVGGAVDFLVARTDVDADRVALVGMSMGGEQAIGAAAPDPRIRGVVAEGATGRTADDKAWLSDEFGVQGWLQQRIDDLTFWFTDLLTSADPPITLRKAAAEIAPRTVLLIAAGGVPDETSAALHIQGGSPGTVQAWVVPEAAHIGGLTTAPEEWEARVVGYLDDLLLGAP